ncbi:hypothetical protein ABIB68_001371 [Bradyrhizobium sp. F1.2.2]
MPGPVPGIHVLSPALQGVDGRDKPGHDGGEAWPQASIAYRLNVRCPRAIDIHPPFTCIRMISVDLASRFSPGPPLEFYRGLAPLFVRARLAGLAAGRLKRSICIRCNPPCAGAATSAAVARPLADSIGFTAPATEVQPAAVEPIGNVATVTGIATVIRDKNSYPLRVRDDIYLNDVVQTSSNSSLGITFDDATTFNLSASTKITIDTYVYEDGGKHNAGIFDIGKGTVAFVAAAVAKTGDMKITTPTATLGIRGTTGVVDVPEGGAANKANNVNIKLYPDGRVGHIDVDDRTSGTRLGALTQGASGFAIRPGAAAAGVMRFAAVPITIAPQQIARDRGFVGQVHLAQTTGRQIVTEQRDFRRANPTASPRIPRPFQPPQQQQLRPNTAPGQQPQRPNGQPGQNNRPGQQQPGAPGRPRQPARRPAAAAAGPRRRGATGYAARGSRSAATRPEATRGASGRPTACRSRHAA